MITLRSAALIFAFATLLSSCDNKQEAGKTADGKTAEAQTIEALPPAEAKITSIAYNFKEGDVRRYKMEQTDEFTQDDSIKATNILSLYYTKTIKRVKDGMITFSIRYDSIQQQQRGSSVNGAPPFSSFRRCSAPPP
ncbi:MAG: hypothetical protein JNL32_15410 [Candidatus Kapabacteria bacterium]|nr:hypothetical protein [Candidatus Kapabacteria bacterium]